MAYIGNIPAEKYQTLQKQSFTTSATDTYTLSYSVTNPQDLALFINNVRQNPNDAYTVSGTTLTLSSAITSSDTMYAVFLGRAVETIAPATGSVTGNMMSYPLTNFSSTGIDDNADATAITIDSSENVGIGTTSPNGILELKSTGNTNFFITAGNTSASQIVLGDADDIDVGKIAYSHNGNQMEFTVNASERMRIANNGKVSVGDSVPYSGGSVNGVQLHSGPPVACSRDSTSGRTQIQFDNPNGTVGSISTSGSSTAYNTSSDHRLKENVVDITGATTRLKQLSPKRFNFIADTDTTVDGFLAHEVQSIIPEAVTGTHNEVDEDGNPVYQGIDQSKLVPLLVATIKELEARIATLEGN